MLSILIPVYNFDIRNLVKELYKQGVNENIPFEIVILDDASDKSFCFINREIADLENVVYKELKQNIGRSKIRNKLVGIAKFEYLLFMDSDACINSNTFIKDYVKECIDEVVVCGGMGYSSNYEQYIKKTEFDLRLKYGNNRECKSAFQRSLTPNKSFMSFNFLISKSILSRVSFDESLLNYGYEDTLFGYELKRQGITIKHINNPLYHLELDSNSVFLSKALAGVKNLFTILNRGYYYKDLKEDVTILRYYARLKILGLTPVISVMYQLTHKSLERNLVKKGQNLFYFDMLRLGLLCSLK